RSFPAPIVADGRREAEEPAAVGSIPGEYGADAAGPLVDKPLRNEQLGTMIGPEFCVFRTYLFREPGGKGASGGVGSAACPEAGRREGHARAAGRSLRPADFRSTPGSMERSSRPMNRSQSARAIVCAPQDGRASDECGRTSDLSVRP